MIQNGLDKLETYIYDNDSAQSAHIGNLKSTYIETNITGPGNLSFYWKVSSESNYDFLRFFIDDIEQANISGEVDWHQMSFDIVRGNHTLKWAYTKDEYIKAGSDCGWLDKVVYSPGGVSVRIRITHLYGNTSAYNGIPMSDIVKRVPEGSTPLDVLQSVANVTMHEGRVYSINGITESPPVYWYLWINGIPAPNEDIDSYQLRDGEVIHWDYSSMINAGNETTQFRPYSIMDYPEPFLHGYDGGGTKTTTSQPSVPQSTDWEILQIKVVNNGTGDANNFDVEVLLDGVPYATTTVSVQAKAYRFLYLPVPKGYNVTVRLDAKNVINESKEANNEITKSSPQWQK